MPLLASSSNWMHEVRDHVNDRWSSPQCSAAAKNAIKTKWHNITSAYRLNVFFCYKTSFPTIPPVTVCDNLFAQLRHVAWSATTTRERNLMRICLGRQDTE
jgi:hypothetical protein